MTTISRPYPSASISTIISKVFDLASGSRIASIDFENKKKESNYGVQKHGPTSIAIMAEEDEISASIATMTEEGEIDNNDWTVQSLSRLEKVAQLPENWDGWGSPGTDPSIVEAIIRLLAHMQNNFGIDVPVPFVCPIAGGGVQFEWTSETKHLELEFIDASTIVFLKEDTKDKAEETTSGEISLQNTNEIRWLIEWFVLP